MKHARVVKAYTGPMKCGKTRRLIEDSKECLISCIPYVVVKHAKVAKNDGKQVVWARDGTSTDPKHTIVVETLTYAEDIIQRRSVQRVFVDEIQLFPDQSVIKQWLERYTFDIHLAGLCTFYDGRPFGRWWIDLMDDFTHFKKMLGFCGICKQKNASGTARTVPEQQGGEGIEIENTEDIGIYCPICSECRRQHCDKGVLKPQTLRKLKQRQRPTPSQPCGAVLVCA